MMLRRILLLLILMVSSGMVVLQGAHQATFVLRNGDRVSGELTYKGGSDYTLNGRDYPSSDVAVIEFVPGDPPATELQQIPPVDNNPSEHERHIIVGRDGNIIFGKIYKFSPDGEMVTYDQREGGRHEVSTDAVARIYVNPGAARSVFNSVVNGPSPVATSGVSGGNTATVNADQPWTDTGIDVRTGDQLRFSVTGQIQIAAGNGSDVTANANGDGNFPGSRAKYPVPALPVGGLIGRVGNSAPFPIGASGQPIRMPARGRLYLGINDDEFGDNSGAFTVTVIR
jgi:hypothetical protein